MGNDRQTAGLTTTAPCLDNVEALTGHAHEKEEEEESAAFELAQGERNTS